MVGFVTCGCIIRFSVSPLLYINWSNIRGYIRTNFFNVLKVRLRECQERHFTCSTFKKQYSFKNRVLKSWGFKFFCFWLVNVKMIASLHVALAARRRFWYSEQSKLLCFPLTKSIYGVRGHCSQMES